MDIRADNMLTDKQKMFYILLFHKNFALVGRLCRPKASAHELRPLVLNIECCEIGRKYVYSNRRKA